MLIYVLLCYQIKQRELLDLAKSTISISGVMSKTGHTEISKTTSDMTVISFRQSLAGDANNLY